MQKYDKQCSRDRIDEKSAENESEHAVIKSQPTLKTIQTGSFESNLRYWCWNEAT